MKRADIIGHLMAISSPEVAELRGRQIANAIFENSRALKPVVEACEEVDKKDDEFQKYAEQQTEIIGEYSSGKNEKGHDVIAPAKKLAFFKAMEDLDERFSECLKQRTDFLTEDVEIEIKKVTVDDLPENISVGLRAQLSFMIE